MQLRALNQATEATPLTLYSARFRTCEMVGWQRPSGKKQISGCQGLEEGGGNLQQRHTVVLIP